LNFQFTQEKNARLFYQNNQATIYLPENKTTEECVSHELLHLYMETKDNMVCGHIHGLILEKQNLRKIFHDELINHVTNCINHVKMLPIFCNMGYEKMSFLMDSYENKCEISYAKKIKRNFKFLNSYSKLVIDNYIGKYFAMKADVSYINYSEQLKILSDTNADLFNTLEVFWNKWTNFDIESNDCIDYWLDDFAGELVHSLDKWTMNKKIN